MELYVARHAETALNAENRVCGISDDNLTEQGKLQAEHLAEELRGVSFGAIFSSPQKRALQTAQPIARQCRLSVREELRLAEQNYGIYEGAARDDPGFLANKGNFAFRYPQGESMMQVAARVYGLLEELKQNPPDKAVLLVTHGGIFRVLNSYFEDMTNDAFFHFGMKNCGWKKYEW